MPDPLVDVLLAVAGARLAEAASLAADAAAADPADPLAAALAAALGRNRTDVYATPAGFQAFIDNASNVELYDATIGHLRAIHHRVRPASVVDVGCGDGRVTVSVLADGVSEIHLVEPSGEMLSQAVGRAGWPVAPTAHHTDLAGFVASLAAAARFDLVQSTFAMHTVPSDERIELAAGLRPHLDRLVIVEFDVPAFADRSREHARYAVDRYRTGVAEYVSHPTAIEGFLMPVLLGQFEPDGVRHTYEGPAQQWRRDLERAGYGVSIEAFHPYWWGPTVCIEAVAHPHTATPAG